MNRSMGQTRGAAQNSVIDERLRGGDVKTLSDMTVHGNAILHRSRILLSLPTGFQLRQFVHSGVLDLLVKQGFRVLILSPNKAGEGFTARLPRNGVEIQTVDLLRSPQLSNHEATDGRALEIAGIGAE
jgi:hypothetical protein